MELLRKMRESMKFGNTYIVSYHKDGILEGYELVAPSHELDWYKMQSEVMSYIGDSTIDNITIIPKII